MWINPETKRVLVNHSILRQDAKARNIELPEILDAEKIMLAGYQVVHATVPQYNPLTSKPVMGNPELTDGKWYQTWIICRLSEAEIAEAVKAFNIAPDTSMIKHVSEEDLNLTVAELAAREK